MKNNFVLSLVFVLGFSMNSMAQIAPSIFPDSSLYKNSLLFGPSYGVMLDRDAHFWGLSIGYAYKLKGPWAISPSIAFDQEFDYSKSETNTVNTFTFIGTITYFIGKNWSVTTGFGKGLADDDQRPKNIELVNGELATGLSVGYNIPDFLFWSRESFAVSSALEYNLTKKEFSLSIDLVMGLSW